jgi:hypothetical protein
MSSSGLLEESGKPVLLPPGLEWMGFSVAFVAFVVVGVGGVGVGDVVG